MENTPTIKTNRLVLRKFTEKDMESLFLILHDEETNRFLPWYPIHDLEETKLFFHKKYVLEYAQPQGYAYAICSKESDDPIGYIKVSTDHRHELGYGFLEQRNHDGSGQRCDRTSKKKMEFLM